MNFSTALPPVFKPKEVEGKRYDAWLEKGCFHAEISGKSPFSIVIPPPNVTGSLHMGHALNNTIQDILIRWKKMQGFETCWFPGTDHAGIATQMVVEREIKKKEGKSRHDLGRDEFVKRVWKWKEEYGGIIDGQLKKLGASCDWERYAFTMDEKRAKAVKEAFVRLHEKGYIYRGLRHVNWCVRCLTALSDLEVEHRENEAPGLLYHLSYPVLNAPEKSIVIATTRPETILADVAVAVHPDDQRYKKLIGRQAVLPLVGRKLKIIADEWADPNVGTGAVKITPAHDPNDFEVGQRHNLSAIKVIAENGKMSLKEIFSENGIPDKTKEWLKEHYEGLDRFECRKKILEDLRQFRVLVKEQEWPSNPGRCARCGEILESYMSTQWFMKMDELAKPAIDAVKNGKVRFHPDRFSRLYLDWMENLRDWCISRQLWWGHRIPVWYCLDCNKGRYAGASENPEADYLRIQVGDFDPAFFSNAKPIEARSQPSYCLECHGKLIVQDPDVLDTWFSSALWPLSTMGWPDENAPDLEYFYPTAVLSTARDIIYLWVARMIMTGLEFRKEIPFHDVYIHSTILDREGRRMSKSKGTGVDPLVLIEKYGADATRFGLILMCQGQDVRYNEEKIEQARNFANKIWNAARFVMPALPENFSGSGNPGAKLKFYDQWILSGLSELAGSVTKDLAEFEFARAASRLYDFFWDDFCDWYLELCKPDLQGNQERRATVQSILFEVLTNSLRLLHPFMPFLTEEIWSGLKEGKPLLLEDAWPLAKRLRPDEPDEKELILMRLFMDAAKGIRNLRAELDLKPTEEAGVEIHTSNLEAYQKLKSDLESLTRSRISLLPQDGRSILHALSFPLSDGNLFLFLEGSVDPQAEIEKKQEEKKEIGAELERVRKILSNPSFVEKAKKEVVEKEREKERLLVEKLERIEQRLKLFTG